MLANKSTIAGMARSYSKINNPCQIQIDIEITLNLKKLAPPFCDIGSQMM
jgi:hypothetical protein